jgi:hypothetical protein
MQRSITYLYPDEDNAANLKMYQERTNQIKGFYFTRESYKHIEGLDSSENYAIYFLFNDSEDENMVYIGQSVNGVKRIDNHNRKKDFWTYGIMFVTDNNSFDKLSIDYMEYEFINKFKKSSFVLTNKDLRANKPNVSIYDLPNLNAYIKQIEFLLSAEGIDIDIADEGPINRKYYFAKGKYNAKIFIKEGKFILVKGSELNRPPEASKEWKYKGHYIRNNQTIDDYIEDGKVKEENGKLITQVNLDYKSPSRPANLVTGLAKNGWKFFQELNELRDEKK